MHMIKRSIQNVAGSPINGLEANGITMKLLVGREDNAPNFAMRHFSIDPKGYTPSHSHDWEHEVLILSGEGELECEGEVTPIKNGDALFIPPNQNHQFRNVGSVQLDFICIVPIESDCGQAIPGS